MGGGRWKRTRKVQKEDVENGRGGREENAEQEEKIVKKEGKKK